MAVKENQTVRIVPSRLMSFPSDVSRFLDRRKGGAGGFRTFWRHRAQSAGTVAIQGRARQRARYGSHDGRPGARVNRAD